MEKTLFLNKLIDVTYCRIGISKISGVGVIAIRDIPNETNPFGYIKFKCNSNYNQNIKVTLDDIYILPDEIKKLVFDFIIPDKYGAYYLPSDGFNSMDISFYLNHSDNPNLIKTDHGCEYYGFKTIRDIKKGEELIIDYENYVE